MQELQGVLVTADIEQARAWMLGYSPEYFSKLAGMNPERRFTLARSFHLLDEKDGCIRFVIDAERMTFEEQDGQMVQSFEDVPRVVILQIKPVREGAIMAWASVASGPFEEQLSEWAGQVLEACRQAFVGKSEEEPG
jgi:hypothetical protein